MIRFNLANNFSPWHQQAAYLCSPISLRMTAPCPHAWIAVGGGRFLSWNLEPDFDEVVVWQSGKFCLTRPETEQEQQDREDADAEIDWYDKELNRYTEWSY